MENLSLKNIPNSVIIGAGLETVVEYGMWYYEVGEPAFKLMNADIKGQKSGKGKCPSEIKTPYKNQFMKFFMWVLDADKNISFIRKHIEEYKKAGVNLVDFEGTFKEILNFKKKYLNKLDKFITAYNASNDKKVSSYYFVVEDKSVVSNKIDGQFYKRTDLDIQLNGKDLSSSLAQGVRYSASKIFAKNRVNAACKSPNSVSITKTI
ncbi:MAG: hypothetical protein K2K31_03345 [Clostridia bacterium]|nr:hypothetical protein [Clostridia bacterium]